jgi:hypothetical protein
MKTGLNLRLINQCCHNLFKELVLPELKKKDKPILFVVIDNLRYDQWKVFESVVNDYYKLEKELSYYSILPTATQYARNYFLVYCR